MILKLFKVTKVVRPEWGTTTVDFEKYFTAQSKETVYAVMRDRYGSLKHYCSYDRCEEEIVIEEVEFEQL